MHHSFVVQAPMGLGKSRVFNFSVFKALLNTLHCGDKFMVKSLQKAPPLEVDSNEEQQMTWTIWINPWRFHMKFGFNWPSGFREDSWTHTHTHTQTHIHTHTHTHTHYIYTTDRQTYIHMLTREPSALNKLYMYSCTPEHNSWEFVSGEKYRGCGVGRGVGGLWRQSTIYFCRGWRGCFFFNPVGGWLLWNCIIFCRWWSFSKMQFCGYPLFKWDLLEWKNDEQTKSRFSRQVKSRRIHCTISW